MNNAFISLELRLNASSLHSDLHDCVDWETLAMSISEACVDVPISPLLAFKAFTALAREQEVCSTTSSMSLASTPVSSTSPSSSSTSGFLPDSVPSTEACPSWLWDCSCAACCARALA